MKRAAGFAASGAVLIGASWGVMALAWRAAEDRRGITIAALLAFLVQLAAYGVVRAAGRKNVFVGWGLGALLRVACLAVFALLLVRHLGLPSGSATLGFAVFLFVSTLVEPLFLNP